MTRYRVTMKIGGVETVTDVESDSPHSAKAKAIGELVLRTKNMPKGVEYDVQELKP